MIHVLATVKVAAGRRAEFLRHFQAVVPLVRAEAGCIEYGPTVDLPTPISAAAPPRDDVVVVVEKWDSPAALQDHLATPHMERYRAAVKDIVESVEIRVLQPA